MLNTEMEPLISHEQYNLSQILMDLSKKFDSKILTERSYALECLINEKTSPDRKEKVLSNYLAFITNPKQCIVQLSEEKEYSLLDIQKIAAELASDKTFFYNDWYLVLDNLDPVYERVTLTDLILSYHLFRLNKEDNNLSLLVKLTAYYTKYAFGTEKYKFSYVLPSEDLSHKDSIALMKKVVLFVTDYLRNNESLFTQYKGQYTLESQQKTPFSSKIDKDASLHFAKITGEDIRIVKILEYFKTFDNYPSICEYSLKNLLRQMYYGGTCESNGKFYHSEPLNNPSIDDLLQLVSQEESISFFDETELNNIRDFLSAIRDRITKNNVSILHVSDEDYQAALNKNSEIENKAALNNIRENIRLLFVIVMVAEIIDEVAANKKEIRNIKDTSRRLCSIFKEDDVPDIILEEKGLNISELKDNEYALIREREKLFKSFLMLNQSSSIEEFFAKRIELLDKARMLAPDDISFLEACSRQLTQKIYLLTDTPDLTYYIQSIREEINVSNASPLSDSVVTALATAEMLFSQYGNEYSAPQGMDYSCISTLYYQGFEKAYNELIWEKYANYLNKELIIDGVRYTDIIFQHFHVQKNSKIESAAPSYGYLPSKAYDLKHYGYFNRPSESFDVYTSCMYGSFSDFIDAKLERELNGFYTWLSNLLGYKTLNSMWKDPCFSDLFMKFRKDMKTAKDYRNNASHGGFVINLDQCKIDRKLVLSDLNSVRTQHLCLIKELIKLFDRSN